MTRDADEAALFFNLAGRADRLTEAYEADGGEVFRRLTGKVHVELTEAEFRELCDALMLDRPIRKVAK